MKMKFNPLTGEFDYIGESLDVITHPYPSSRNIEVVPNTFTAIWNNITIPARSEVYARVTMNLQSSPCLSRSVRQVHDLRRDISFVPYFSSF